MSMENQLKTIRDGSMKLVEIRMKIKNLQMACLKDPNCRPMRSLQELEADLEQATKKIMDGLNGRVN